MRQQLNHNLLWQYCVQLCQTAYPDAPRQTVQELLSLLQTSSGLLAVNNTLIFGPSIKDKNKSEIYLGRDVSLFFK